MEKLKKGYFTLIPYVGSKYKIKDEIISLIPHFHHYVEVFGGGGSVLLDVKKYHQKKIVYNDFNTSLWAFFYSVQNDYQRLENTLKSFIRSRDFFNYAKNICKSPLDFENKDEIYKRGALFYYIIKNSFASAANSFVPSENGFYILDFKHYAQKLKDVICENLDYTKLIKKYDRTDTIFYIDPPYLNTKKYFNQQKCFDKDEFIKLFTILKNIKGKFILSHKKDEFIENLFKEFFYKEIDYFYASGLYQSKIDKELLFTNFTPQTENYSLLGD